MNGLQVITPPHNMYILYRNTGVWVLQPHKHMHARTHAHVCTRVHTHMHAWTHARACAQTHTQNILIQHTHIHTPTHTNTDTDTDTHTHTHTHTHTDTIADSLCSSAKVNILCIVATIGHSPPLLWV